MTEQRWQRVEEIARALWFWMSVLNPVLVLGQMAHEGGQAWREACRRLRLGTREQGMILLLAVVGIGGWYVWGTWGGGGLLYGGTMIGAGLIAARRDLALLRRVLHGERAQARVIPLRRRRTGRSRHAS